MCSKAICVMCNDVKGKAGNNTASVLYHVCNVIPVYDINNAAAIEGGVVRSALCPLDAQVWGKI